MRTSKTKIITEQEYSKTSPIKGLGKLIDSTAMITSLQKDLQNLLNWGRYIFCREGNCNDILNDIHVIIK